MIGQRLGGRYELKARIGGGGMALVYRAHDHVLNRQVAVKVLRPQFATDEDFVRRFRREAQAAASLSHPHIVSIYDVGNDGDTHYIVMELIEGRTLKERIQEEKRLPVTEALEIAYQICDALDHAHQNHIIHRDIKPHNILLTKSGRVKVTDFGIARAMTSATLTHTGTIIGSVHYFSPEQARGGLTGAKSDLYSLGVVLYEMLTGTLPFQGESAVTIALKHMHERVIPPRTLNPEVPADVDRMVMRALEKNQLERYASAAEMLSDLGRCLGRARTPAGAQIAPASTGRSPTLPPRRLPPERPRTRPVVSPAPAAPPPETREDGGDEEEGESVVRRRRRPWVGWLLALALVATVVAGAGYMAWDWLNVPTVEVPNVVGLNYMAAQNLLREQGLMAEQVATVFHDQVPANHVVEQIPPAFSMVKKGRSIKLVVSQGQASVIVPDLRGLTQREANVQLLNLGLALGHIKYEHHPTFALDTVIEQNPRANTVVSTSTPFVDVVVSLGPEPRLIKVPDLTGQQVGQAQRSLEALSLRLGELSKEHSDQPEGTVLRQEPTAGAEVEPDTVVNLWYSAGPLTSGQTDRIVFKVPKDRGTVLVQVWVADGTGSREVHKGTYRGDDEIELWIKWFGAQARVVVFVDGLPLYEVTLPQS